MYATLFGDAGGHWSGRVLNVPPGSGRVVTASAYASSQPPADPADTTNLIYRGSKTNVTVTAGELTGVVVPLLPWPDGGGGFGVNTPPHITSVTHPTSMASNGSTFFTATAVDPDPSATLTYQWSDDVGGSFSGGDLFSPSNFSNQEPGQMVTVGYTPPPGFVGTTTIRVTVSDGFAVATTTFPIGIGSGIDVGLVFDVLPVIEFLSASSQDLLQGGTSFIDWRLSYPSGAGPDAPTVLQVSTAWTDSCGGTFSPTTASLVVTPGQPTQAQQVAYTAPSGDPDLAQCSLTLTVADLAGATTFSQVIVWVNPGVAPPAGPMVAFVTSLASAVDGAHFSGNLMAADDFCTGRASAGGLPSGMYKAFLSKSGQEALDSIPDAAYVLPDGTPLVGSLADLLDGTIGRPIDVDEFGNGGIGTAVWTGTAWTGQATGQDCDGWTSTTGTATVGYSDWASSNWANGSLYPCDQAKPIYCFQWTQGVIQ